MRPCGRFVVLTHRVSFNSLCRLGIHLFFSLGVSVTSLRRLVDESEPLTLYLSFSRVESLSTLCAALWTSRSSSRASNLFWSKCSSRWWCSRRSSRHTHRRRQQRQGRSTRKSVGHQQRLSPDLFLLFFSLYFSISHSQTRSLSLLLYFLFCIVFSLSDTQATVWTVAVLCTGTSCSGWSSHCAHRQLSPRSR